MITLLPLTCLASLSAHQPVDAVLSAASTFAAPTAIAAAPQGDRRRPTGGGSPTPSGGTPEPTVLLLLAGGAIGYVGLRARMRKNTDKQS
jgi:hypothetical protein